MKKRNIIMFIILVVLVLSFSGCMYEGGRAPIQESPAPVDTEELPIAAAEKAQISQNLPDLAVINVSWSNSSGLTEHSISFDAIIDNLGNESITGFLYFFEIHKGDGLILRDNNTYSSKFYPGKNVVKSLLFTPELKGDYVGKIILDPNNDVKESNESNNFMSLKLSVEKYDPNYINLTEFFGNKTCVDSDNGRNYNVSGSCRDKYSMTQSMSDFCMGDYTLNELYCKGNASCAFEEYDCPHICRDGRCY